MFLSRAKVTQRYIGLEQTLRLSLFLGFLALFTYALQWLQHDPETIETFVGPPRTDFQLSNMSIQTLNEQGKLAFSVHSPRAVKHPYLGTFAIDTPQFRMIDAQNNTWVGDSASAWVSENAQEIHLEKSVNINRVATPDTDALSIRTAFLKAEIEQSLLSSHALVTITTTGSILSGVGMLANLKDNSIVLNDRVNAHYVSKNH
jgi:lipopolysaccharide export system protein LptC